MEDLSRRVENSRPAVLHRKILSKTQTNKQTQNNAKTNKETKTMQSKIKDREEENDTRECYER
jgi:hypothetical protein